MRNHSNHIQAEREEALRLIIAHTPLMTETELVPVAQAAGRVLAEDAVSLWDCPNARTCRMDSVAVHWDDFADGMPDTSEWLRGRDWTFANTGVAMPKGFDTAIVVEQTELSEKDEKIRLLTCPAGRYEGTLPPGGLMKKGDLLVPAGTRITPRLAARIAGGNNTGVRVRKRPVVEFIPTGNELVHADGGPVPPGKNLESTSILIAEKVRGWGGEPMVCEIVPDEREAIRRAITRAAERADIVVLNAGSSKGSDDWSMEVLEELGTVYYHQTNHGPGHHSSFAMVFGTPVVGLPGPADGAAVTADFYLYPVVRAALGLDPVPQKVKVRLAASLGPSNSRSDRVKNRRFETGAFYVVKQMRLSCGRDGVLEAWPPDSPHPDALAAEAADAYLLQLSSAGATDPQPGELIEVELRPR